MYLLSQNSNSLHRQYGSTNETTGPITMTRTTNMTTTKAATASTTATATMSTITIKTTTTSRRYAAIFLLSLSMVVIVIPLVGVWKQPLYAAGSMSIVRQPSPSRTTATKVSLKEQKAKHQNDFATTTTKEGDSLVVTADDGTAATADYPPPPTNSHQAYDLITKLPGLNYNPGFRQYSGYITLQDSSTDFDDMKKHMFYWFVESQSSDPRSDPLVLWTNGGPGCSGLVGFGTEHGPFLFHKNMTLSKNIYSWNTIANMLYIEQPCGVGFSYYSSKSNEKTTKTTKLQHRHQDDDDKNDKPDYYTSIGDKQASKDMYSMIRQFLQRFPQYQKNEFYIASESYGGHYMPQLTLEILKRNAEILNDSSNDGDDYDGPLVINFKGMIVGNPYVDPYTNTVTQLQTLYTHGIIPKYPTYQNWVDHCSRDPTKYIKKGKCENYFLDVMISLKNHINPYGIDYPLCLEDPNPYGNSISGTEVDPATHISAQASQLLQYLYPYDSSYHERRYLRQDMELSFASSSTVHDGVGGDSIVQTNYLPCAKKYFTDYLNSGQEVLDALHARLVVHSNNNGDGTPSSSTPLWKECANDIHYSREDFMTPVVDLYRKLLVGDDDDDDVASISRHERDLYFFRKGGHSSRGDSFSSNALNSVTGGRKHANEEDDKNKNNNGDGIRMLIFSGDDDSVCSTAGTQTWIWGLGVDPKSDNEIWQPWTRDDGQVAGYVTQFDMSPHFHQKKDSKHLHRHGDDYGGAVVSSFSFVTVRGAGHEVPSYRPKQALEVFRKFLNGEW